MILRRLLYVVLVSSVFCAAGALQSQTAAKIGIVLMHGKSGTAMPRSPIGPLRAALQGAGFLVATPAMPWSRIRGEGYAFAKAPRNPKSAYVLIDSNHRDTPVDGADKIIDWLKKL